MGRAENFVIETTYDNIFSPTTESSLFSGRLYDSESGYVDITTPTALTYSDSSIEIPVAGGQLLLTGAANSRALMTMLATEMALLELDLNNDSVYEVSAVLPWSLLIVAGTNPDDADGDGIPDSWEQTNGMNPKDYSDPDNDVDSDGLSNREEYEAGTDLSASDTDSDGIADGWEIAYSLNPVVDDASGDLDSDGLSNLDEFINGTDPSNPDTDGDSLSDAEEVNTYFTNPNTVDSDGDQIDDRWEIANGLDPLVEFDASSDADSDGFVNLIEYILSSDPNDALSVPAVPEWTTYQGGASHTGFVPLILDPVDFSERWSAGPFVNYSLNPVTVAESKVFVSMNLVWGSTHSIAAIDSLNGSVIWENEYRNINRINPPAYANGKVYFQTSGSTDDDIFRG